MEQMSDTFPTDNLDLEHRLMISRSDWSLIFWKEPARPVRLVSSIIGIRSVSRLIMRKIGKSDFPGESEKIISMDWKAG